MLKQWQAPAADLNGPSASERTPEGQCRARRRKAGFQCLGNDYGLSQGEQATDSYLNHGSRTRRFPEHVMEKIMRRVAFQDLVSWRRVCKRWNSAVLSQEWTSGTNPLTSIPLIMRTRELSTAGAAFLALNQDYSKWFRIDIGHILTGLNLYCSNGEKCSPCFRCTSIGRLGLLLLTCTCFIHWNSDISLMIFNPITKKLKPLKIPEVPSEYIIHSYCTCHFRLAGVIETANEQHYRLLFSTVYPNFEQSFRVYCVYDSQNSTWTFGRGPMKTLPFIFSKVSCKGCFYYLHRKVEGGEDVTIRSLFCPSMGKYDSETNRWSEIPWVPTHENSFIWLPQLVQYRGNLLYVAFPGCRARCKSPKCSPLWRFYKLDESASSFLELWTNLNLQLRVPTAIFITGWLYDEKTRRRQDVRCEGQGDNIFLYGVQPGMRTCAFSVRPLLSSCSTSQHVAKNGAALRLDGQTCIWKVLPDYYPLQEADDSSVYTLESFRPSFMEP